MYEELLNMEWSELVYASFAWGSAVAIMIVALLMAVMAYEARHQLTAHRHHVRSARRVG